jgi:uncharacterized membrane protein (DUF106 family)
MTWLNLALGWLVGTLLAPFRPFSPLVGLTVVSFVTAVGMLVVFRRTSDQRALADVKRRIHACLFEIRLFNDDLPAIFRAQFEVLRHNATYLRLSIVPLLWMIGPLVLLIAQLQFYYAYDGLTPGRSALVKARLKAGAAEAGRTPEITLEAPPGIRIETPRVWVPALGETAWRIGAERPGAYDVTVTIGGRRAAKRIVVSDEPGFRAPDRLEGGFFNQLLYPAEPPIGADVPLEAISVTYPDRSIDVFGWPLHWMIVFFALSIVFAFVLRKRFDVVI